MSNQNDRLGLLKILPLSELEEIFQLPAPQKSRLLIGGYADYSSEHLILFRGDGTIAVAPFKMFYSNGTNAPNFDDYEVIDFGHTLRLGSYEASTRSILYDLDPEYNKYCESIRIQDPNIN